MIRRDFLKLCVAAASALVVKTAIKPKYDINEIPLSIMLVSVSAQTLAQGESRPEDGEHGEIKFEALQTGVAHWVIINHLDTGERVACLTIGTTDPHEPPGDITFNSKVICMGDTILICGLST